MKITSRSLYLGIIPLALGFFLSGFVFVESDWEEILQLALSHEYWTQEGIDASANRPFILVTNGLAPSNLQLKMGPTPITLVDSPQELSSTQLAKPYAELVSTKKKHQKAKMTLLYDGYTFKFTSKYSDEGWWLSKTTVKGHGTTLMDIGF